MWIEHDGSGMPVSGDTLVYIRDSTGFDDSFCTEPMRADWWHEDDPNFDSWTDNGEGNVYIVAYKVAS